MDSSADRLGAFIREQRMKARLSLRQLAERTNVSNPYLSQIERGLHEPSVRVLRAIAEGLEVSAEALLEYVGGRQPQPVLATEACEVGTVEAAIAADPRLSAEQKWSLTLVYRAYLSARGQAGVAVSHPLEYRQPAGSGNTEVA